MNDEEIKRLRNHVLLSEDGEEACGALSALIQIDGGRPTNYIPAAEMRNPKRHYIGTVLSAWWDTLTTYLSCFCPEPRFRPASAIRRAENHKKHGIQPLVTLISLCLPVSEIAIGSTITF